MCMVTNDNKKKIYMAFVRSLLGEFFYVFFLGMFFFSFSAHASKSSEKVKEVKINVATVKAKASERAQSDQTKKKRLLEKLNNHLNEINKLVEQGPNISESESGLNISKNKQEGIRLLQEKVKAAEKKVTSGSLSDKYKSIVDINAQQKAQETMKGWSKKFKKAFTSRPALIIGGLIVTAFAGYEMYKMKTMGTGIFSRIGSATSKFWRDLTEGGASSIEDVLSDNMIKKIKSEESESGVKVVADDLKAPLKILTGSLLSDASQDGAVEEATCGLQEASVELKLAAQDICPAEDDPKFSVSAVLPLNNADFKTNITGKSADIENVQNVLVKEFKTDDDLKKAAESAKNLKDVLTDEGKAKLKNNLALMSEEVDAKIKQLEDLSVSSVTKDKAYTLEIKKNDKALVVYKKATEDQLPLYLKTAGDYKEATISYKDPTITEQGYKETQLVLNKDAAVTKKQIIKTGGNGQETIEVADKAKLQELSDNITKLKALLPSDTKMCDLKFNRVNSSEKAFTITSGIGALDRFVKDISQHDVYADGEIAYQDPTMKNVSNYKETRLFVDKNGAVTEKKIIKIDNTGKEITENVSIVDVASSKSTADTNIERLKAFLPSDTKKYVVVLNQANGDSIRRSETGLPLSFFVNEIKTESNYIGGEVTYEDPEEKTAIPHYKETRLIFSKEGVVTAKQIIKIDNGKEITEDVPIEKGSELLFERKVAQAKDEAMKKLQDEGNKAKKDQLDDLVTPHVVAKAMYGDAVSESSAGGEDLIKNPAKTVEKLGEDLQLLNSNPVVTLSKKVGKNEDLIIEEAKQVKKEIENIDNKYFENKKIIAEQEKTLVGKSSTVDEASSSSWKKPLSDEKLNSLSSKIRSINDPTEDEIKKNLSNAVRGKDGYFAPDEENPYVRDDEKVSIYKKLKDNQEFITTWKVLKKIHPEGTIKISYSEDKGTILYMQVVRHCGVIGHNLVIPLEGASWDDRFCWTRWHGTVIPSRQLLEFVEATSENENKETIVRVFSTLNINSVDVVSIKKDDNDGFFSYKGKVRKYFFHNEPRWEGKELYVNVNKKLVSYNDFMNVIKSNFYEKTKISIYKNGQAVNFNNLDDDTQKKILIHIGDTVLRDDHFDVSPDSNNSQKFSHVIKKIFINTEGNLEHESVIVKKNSQLFEPFFLSAQEKNVDEIVDNLFKKESAEVFIRGRTGWGNETKKTIKLSSITNEETKEKIKAAYKKVLQQHINWGRDIEEPGDLNIALVDEELTVIDTRNLLRISHEHPLYKKFYGYLWDDGLKSRSENYELLQQLTGNESYATSIKNFIKGLKSEEIASLTSEAGNALQNAASTISSWFKPFSVMSDDLFRASMTKEAAK